MKITYNLPECDLKEVILGLQLVKGELRVSLPKWDIHVGELGPRSIAALVRQDGTNVLLHTNRLDVQSIKPAPKWPWVFAVESLEGLGVGGAVTWSQAGLLTVGAGVDHCGYEFFSLTLVGLEDHDHHFVFRQVARDRFGRLIPNAAMPTWDSQALRTDEDLENGFAWLPPAKCNAESGCSARAWPQKQQVAHISESKPRVQMTGDAELDQLLAGIGHKTRRAASSAAHEPSKR